MTCQVIYQTIIDTKKLAEEEKVNVTENLVKKANAKLGGLNYLIKQDEET